MAVGLFFSDNTQSADSEHYQIFNENANVILLKKGRLCRRMPKYISNQLNLEDRTKKSLAFICLLSVSSTHSEFLLETVMFTLGSHQSLSGFIFFFFLI